jgi:hypothetical protein
MIADAILFVLTTSNGAVPLEDLQCRLNGVCGASLQFHLARLEECGVIKRLGVTYRLPESPPTSLVRHVGGIWGLG